MIPQIDAQEAKTVFETQSDAVYLDVRTPEEYQAGHAAGAWNVPAFFLDASRNMIPNQDFERVVRAALPKERTIIVGCQSGVRSQKAAEILERLGYGDVRNLRGGFGGARDASGQIVARGWRDSGFPVETGSSPGLGYEDLRQKA